ncbi:Hypothetical_protein [Hexamita inflata]|uniref:Hypothetical_protein n=1 Tax=Hexamita inflata TaxID=28002 RepID=A0AA86QND7_9EUKA|nr:Hypothetical protein HINF_LOCUS50554 [Hexamita inflata]
MLLGLTKFAQLSIVVPLKRFVPQEQLCCKSKVELVLLFPTIEKLPITLFVVFKVILTPVIVDLQIFIIEFSAQLIKPAILNQVVFNQVPIQPVILEFSIETDEFVALRINPATNNQYLGCNVKLVIVEFSIQTAPLVIKPTNAVVTNDELLVELQIETDPLVMLPTNVIPDDELIVEFSIKTVPLLIYPMNALYSVDETTVEFFTYTCKLSNNSYAKLQLLQKEIKLELMKLRQSPKNIQKIPRQDFDDITDVLQILVLVHLTLQNIPPPQDVQFCTVTLINIIVFLILQYSIKGLNPFMSLFVIYIFCKYTQSISQLYIQPAIIPISLLD